MSHNHHATTKVISKYFKNSLLNGKDPFTRDMDSQFYKKLSCKISYWKIYKGIQIAKSLVKGTHEHGYAVFDVQRYILESTNLEGKMILHVDGN